MSGFIKHNRKHVSNSQCETFSDNPWLYIYQNIMGNYEPAGPSAFRGQAAEVGVTMGLMDLSAPIEACQEHALKEFDRLTLLNTSEKAAKEREGIPGMVAQALGELRPYGTPSHIQHEFYWQSPELPIPFKGVIDFMWQEHGIILDLKTKAQLPSKIDPGHARQLSLYGSAISDNYGLRVCYATPKKCATYEVENAKQHLNSLVRIAKAIDNFLNLHDDPAVLLAALAPNKSSFKFSEQLKARAFELTGI